MADNSLRQLLERSLPPGRLALLRLVADQAAASGSALYIVGGFVRDLILEAPSLDFDFVVEGDAIALAGQLARKYGGQVHSHRRFGTAKWTLDQSSPALSRALGSAHGELPARLDFVTARSESYARPTALPSVAEGDIRGDLKRRDFSINALALRLDGPHYGELLDVEDGARDLERERIRVLHDGSFEDDPTRALRAVRLEQRLGFEIEPGTLALIQPALPLLGEVSGERIRSELTAMFQEPKLDQIMLRLRELGLLAAIHPELSWDDWLAARFQAAQTWTTPQDWRLMDQPAEDQLMYALWVYRVSEQAAESICERLRLSQADRRVVLRAGRLDCDLTEALPPSRVVGCLEPVPEAALAATWLALEGERAARQTIERFLREWRWVRPSIDGTKLRELGLPPGPAYRKILERLRQARLDGEVASESQEAELLAELIEAERDG